MEQHIQTGMAGVQAADSAASLASSGFKLWKRNEPTETEILIPLEELYQGQAQVTLYQVFVQKHIERQAALYEKGVVPQELIDDLSKNYTLAQSKLFGKRELQDLYANLTVDQMSSILCGLYPITLNDIIHRPTHNDARRILQGLVDQDVRALVGRLSTTQFNLLAKEVPVKYLRQLLEPLSRGVLTAAIRTLPPEITLQRLVRTVANDTLNRHFSDRERIDIEALIAVLPNEDLREVIDPIDPERMESITGLLGPEKLRAFIKDFLPVDELRKAILLVLDPSEIWLAANPEMTSQTLLQNQAEAVIKEILTKVISVHVLNKLIQSCSLQTLSQMQGIVTDGSLKYKLQQIVANHPDSQAGRPPAGTTSQGHHGTNRSITASSTFRSMRNKFTRKPSATWATNDPENSVGSIDPPAQVDGKSRVKEMLRLTLRNKRV